MLRPENQELQNGNGANLPQASTLDETNKTTQKSSKSSQPKQPSLGAFIDQCLDTRFSMTDFFSLLQSACSADRFEQHRGIIGLRKILSTGDPPIQPVIDGNMVPRLIEFLERDDEPRLQLEAAWIITNIASGTSMQIQSLVEQGVIPHLIKLLSCRKNDVSEQAIWALGNIAGDASSLRDLILKSGGLDPLIALIYSSSNDVLIKVGTWTISNLCRGRPLPNYELTKNAIPILSKVIQQSDDIETLTDATWALSYLSDGGENRIETVVQTNIIPTLVKFLKSEYFSLLIPAIRVIGNIATGNASQTNLILEIPESMQRISLLLNHKKKPVRREVCWLLSCIAAGTPDQIDCIIKNDELLTKLMNLFISDVREVQKEACWIFHNLVNAAKPDQMAQLLQASLLDTFLQSLRSDDAKILELSLQGISSFLSYGESLGLNEEGTNPILHSLEAKGAIQSIENLQQHPNDAVYSKALSILERYFELEELSE